MAPHSSLVPKKIPGSTQGKTESLDQDQVLLVFSSSVLFFVDFRSWSAIKVKQTVDTSLFPRVVQIFFGKSSLEDKLSARTI